MLDSHQVYSLFYANAEQIPLESESVHHIVTSPPYNVGVKYDKWKDYMERADYLAFSERWLSESFRILKPSGRIALNLPVFGNDKNHPKGEGAIVTLADFIPIIQKVGFTVRETITWIKSSADSIAETESNFSMNSTAWGSYMSPKNPYCRSVAELIVVCHKQEARIAWEGVSDISRDEFLKLSRNVWIMPSKTSKNHPARFPVELPYNFMKFYTYVNDIVYDPFVGLGSTIMAGVGCGRRVMGSDISEKYLELAGQLIDKTIG